MDALQLLNNRLDLLLKKYTALQAENDRLQQALAKQLQGAEQLNAKLAALEEKMLVMQVGGAVTSDDEKLSLRRQLDTVIGEIDKMLASLND